MGVPQCSPHVSIRTFNASLSFLSFSLLWRPLLPPPSTRNKQPSNDQFSQVTQIRVLLVLQFINNISKSENPHTQKQEKKNQTFNVDSKHLLYLCMNWVMHALAYVTFIWLVIIYMYLIKYQPIVQLHQFWNILLLSDYIVTFKILNFQPSWVN